jgi:hypothetical protein
MSGYIGNIPTPQATQTRDTFTATSGQTSFATSGYTPNFLDVYLNGVHLVNGTDYTASNGSDVVLTTGATTGDNLEVVSYSTYEVNAQTYTGGLTAKNDGAAAITANRLTSDGTILDLKKDGTTVGSIGTVSSALYIGSQEGTDSFIKFTGDRVQPSTSAGANRDAAIDLGASGNRFKNLYLSGGVYLGGTGSANLLDDYEEGTWTPAFNTGTGITYASQVGHYTKIGNVVNFHFHLGWSAGTSLSTVITGLPFTVRNANETYPMCSVLNDSGTTYAAGRTTLIAYPLTNATSVQMDGCGSGIGAAGPTFGTSGNIYVTGFYYTDA